jgi:hypothetical protein
MQADENERLADGELPSLVQSAAVAHVRKSDPLVVRIPKERRDGEEYENKQKAPEPRPPEVAPESVGREEQRED